MLLARYPQWLGRQRSIHTSHGLLMRPPALRNSAPWLRGDGCHCTRICLRRFLYWRRGFRGLSRGEIAKYSRASPFLQRELLFRTVSDEKIRIINAERACEVRQRYIVTECLKAATAYSTKMSQINFKSRDFFKQKLNDRHIIFLSVLNILVIKSIQNAIFWPFVSWVTYYFYQKYSKLSHRRYI